MVSPGSRGIDSSGMLFLCRFHEFLSRLNCSELAGTDTTLPRQQLGLALSAIC